MAEIIHPSQNAKLRYKFPRPGLMSYQNYDAIIILIDAEKNSYRVRDLHTNSIENFSLESLNQEFIILKAIGRYGD